MIQVGDFRVPQAPLIVHLAVLVRRERLVRIVHSSVSHASPVSARTAATGAAASACRRALAQRSRRARSVAGQLVRLGRRDQVGRSPSRSSQSRIVQVEPGSARAARRPGRTAPARSAPAGARGSPRPSAPRPGARSRGPWRSRSPAGRRSSTLVDADRSSRSASCPAATRCAPAPCPPSSALISDDFPTFERPRKTTSGPGVAGSSSRCERRAYEATAADLQRISDSRTSGAVAHGARRISASAMSSAGRTRRSARSASLSEQAMSGGSLSASFENLVHVLDQTKLELPR